MKKSSLKLLISLCLVSAVVDAQSTSHVAIGGVTQQAEGADNNNRISIVSAPAGNAVINDVVQQANGSANSNLISIHATHVNAGLLFQNATGHGSLNELTVGGLASSISLGDIIQEAHHGEANVIRIGTSLTD